MKTSFYISYIELCYISPFFNENTITINPVSEGVNVGAIIRKSLIIKIDCKIKEWFYQLRFYEQWRTSERLIKVSLPVEQAAVLWEHCHLNQLQRLRGNLEIAINKNDSNIETEQLVMNTAAYLL